MQQRIQPVIVHPLPCFNTSCRPSFHPPCSHKTNVSSTPRHPLRFRHPLAAPPNLLSVYHPPVASNHNSSYFSEFLCLCLSVFCLLLDSILLLKVDPCDLPATLLFFSRRPLVQCHAMANGIVLTCVVSLARFITNKEVSNINLCSWEIFRGGFACDFRNNKRRFRTCAESGRRDLWRTLPAKPNFGPVMSGAAASFRNVERLLHVFRDLRVLLGS